MKTVLFVDLTYDKFYRCMVPHIPQVGTKVDGVVEYRPYPTVRDVLNYPSPSTLKEMGLSNGTEPCSAVVFIE